MIDLVHEQLKDDDSAPAREEAYFAGARLNDDELRDAAAEDEQRRAQARARHAEATRSNLGLGHDIRAALIQPSDAQLHARQGHRLPAARPPLRRADRLRRRLDRPRAPATRRRHRPPRAPHPDTIVDAELDRALGDPDPLRGIAQLAARLGAAFTLDPDGVTRTKALGTERMARKLRDALPGGDSPLRAASGSSCGRCSRQRSSRSTATPSSRGRARDTVDLAGRDAASSLEELDLDEPRSEAT